MGNRRSFLRQIAGAAAFSTLAPSGAADNAPPTTASDDRAYWVRQLARVAEPVLANMAANTLKQRMPVESPASRADGRRPYTHLEALGRTLAGIAPWLELADKPATEVEPGRKMAELARRSIANATDPAAADFINFTAGGQCLVDAAFLAHAMIRGREQLWHKLDATVQQRVIAALKSTRKFTPGRNNWLLFSAMIEALLASVGAEWKEQPIDTAVTAHEEWYKGDGVYGDGPEFHWDYYNSYVIQPMLIDVLEQMKRVTPKWDRHLPDVLARARRYAAIQERLVAPDGTFPAIGRSIAYRCGAFQLLAQMALRQELSKDVSAPQVRGALGAVVHRTLDAPGTFEREGWLRVGLAGGQPGLAEGYISTGSLYLCTAVFLPLGLPPSSPFWSGPPAPWTSKKIWAGQDLTADHALKMPSQRAATSR